ncbi:MAG: SDR family NAD(P)-dependent oxidoreductase [Actinomycetota bacterium]|nr:SDR family NAD(P)-dependent oxidoreductase [Actinomycetota bacterium]
MRVLVTGAASGFGAGVMRELRARGENVRGIDLHDGDAVFRADIRDSNAVETAVGRAVDELGGLDVLINNAGIGAPADAGAMPDETTLETIDVNLFGAWRVTAAALDALLESRGRVINVASALAFVSAPYCAAYCASKRGLAAYSDVLRLEAGGRIKVSTVYPGYVRTRIHQRSERLGFTLSGAVPEEPLDAVVRAIIRTCYAKRPARDVATTRRTAAGVFFARHLPRSLDALARLQIDRLRRRGHFDGIQMELRLLHPDAPASSSGRVGGSVRGVRRP